MWMMSSVLAPKVKETFLLNYLNSIDPHIKFTVEQPNVEGAIPFLDTFPQPKGENISVSVYRKPTTHGQVPGLQFQSPYIWQKSCGKSPYG